MELKEALAELRVSLANWKWRKEQGGNKSSEILHSCAIPVAETLLAALEEKPIGCLIRCPYCRELFGYRYPEYSHKCAEPAERPTKLAGRTVDGWGWKVFQADKGQLYSEIFGRARGGFSASVSLPENQWLHYRDWQESPNKGDYPFHILDSTGAASRWMFGRESSLILRQVAWCRLRDQKPTHVLTDFLGDIFTAEEIYILPEEGMPVPPAERPPEKGDWVVHKTGFFKGVRQVDGPRGKMETDCGGVYAITANRRIVRRAADRLRVGDEGLLDGTVKVWVNEISVYKPHRLLVVFSKKNAGNKDYANIDYGEIEPDRFTLVQPVYDRPAEKGDC